MSSEPSTYFRLRETQALNAYFTPGHPVHTATHQRQAQKSNPCRLCRAVHTPPQNSPPNTPCAHGRTATDSIPRYSDTSTSSDHDKTPIQHTQPRSPPSRPPYYKANHQQSSDQANKAATSHSYITPFTPIYSPRRARLHCKATSSTSDAIAASVSTTCTTTSRNSPNIPTSSQLTNQCAQATSWTH